MIKDEALSKIESESLFKHEAMKGVSEKEAPFFDRKFDEEVIHNKDEPNEQETSENGQDMQMQDQNAGTNRNRMHSHSLAYKKEPVKSEPTSPFLRKKEVESTTEKSDALFDKSKTRKSKFQTESGKKFEVQEDLLLESMKRNRKVNPKYTEKELRQKAYFIQKLKGAKSVSEKGSPDGKIAEKKFQKNLESKCKNQWYYETQVKPFLSSVKYHIAQSLSYEDDQDFNGDENVLETTTSSAKFFVSGGMQNKQTVNKEAKKNRRYKTEQEKMPKKKNSVGDIDLMIQERKNQKKYMAARKSEEQFRDGVHELSKKIVSKIKEIATKNKSLLLVLVVCLVFLLMGFSMISVITEAFSSATGTYLGGVSPTTDMEMTSTDNYFTQLEAMLQDKLDHPENYYEGYDIYIVNCPQEIGHDAFFLMAYLSAMYEGYDLSSIQTELDTLFSSLYKVTTTSSTEGSGDDAKKVLTIDVEKADWDDLMAIKITDDKKDLYKTYTETGGGHQAYHNPFSSNWSQNVSSEFGWRIHPITGEEKFHNGIDIALPSGTPIQSVSIGTVVKSYYSSSAGNYIVIEDSLGYQSHYMHLSERYVNVGDVVSFDTVIGTVGSTGRSTGPHLHLGVSDPSGNYMNPKFLVQGGN